MKNYVINSIVFDNCLKSNKEDLKSLESCKNCGKLPLPSFRSKTNPEKCLCNECYLVLKMNTNDLMTNHIRAESKILDRLIFSCKNHRQGCVEVFKHAELDQLILHHENCDKKLTTNDNKKCNYCKLTFLKDNLHNCLINHINDNDERLNQIIEMFDKKI